jgi:hypothetical protein
VVDLQGWLAAVAQAHFGKAREGKDAVVAAQIELAFLVAGFVDVDYGITHVDDPDPARGKGPEEIHELLRDLPVAAGQIRRWRRQLQAVLKLNAPDADRFKNMRIS